MRHVLPLFALFGALLPALPGALAQAPAGPPAAAAPARPTVADPPLARVDGELVRLSDVLTIAADLLPPETRAIPGNQLLDRLPPEVVERLIERAIAERALVNEALRQGLDRHELVRARVARAEAQELQQALLAREAVAALSEVEIRARYDQNAVGAGGEQEVRARHILVANEADARAAIAEVAGGAEFAAVAARRSTDAGSRATGGDLGFFKRDQMLPEFATAAFALAPGAVSPAPVRTPLGWHVIKVEARRSPEAVPYEQARETLRQQMLGEKVEEVVRRVRGAATVERLDRPAAPAASVPGLLDGAAPPAPPSPAPPAPTRR